MRVFVDTNVLLTATDPQRTHHAAALAFLQSGKHQLFTSPQVFREYLVVATRPPANNGQGLSIHQALENVAAFSKVIAPVFETEPVWAKLRELLAAPEGPSGKQIHDANIAATAITHGLTTLATFNPSDFTPFPITTTQPTTP
ncbi:MAG: type II toxin-antitoxin system VapC family toxin [Bifidobacteriaceae bacterium]|nr:type II toxin-antitoxin system VapC family toxin [Bifidobacteriaceae bacterium]